MMDAIKEEHSLGEGCYHAGAGEEVEGAEPEEHLPGPGHLLGHHPLPHLVLHLYLPLERDSDTAIHSLCKLATD